MEIVLHTLLALGLHIEVLEVIPADGLSLILIKSLSLLINKLLKSVPGITQTSLVGLGGHNSEHVVVRVVDVQLERMLVVCEQRVVPVGQVGERTALMSKELLDGH